VRALVVWTLGLIAIAAFVVICSPDEAASRRLPQTGGLDGEGANLASPRQDPTSVRSRRMPPEPLDGTALKDNGSPPSYSSSGASALHLPADLSEGFTPTREGLSDLTIGLWEQEEFLSMPWEEIAHFLPIDELAPYRGASTLGEYVGGLPTEGDLDNAMRDPEVHELLFELQTAEVWLALAYERPHERRGPLYRERVERVQEIRRSLSLGLMSRLERVTGYRHWTLLWSLHERWETGQ